MGNIIEAISIRKSFKQMKNNVLDNINFNVKKGEFVTIMGPSGCGKSTLLFALSGMDSIDKGMILFNGIDVSKKTENQLSDMRRLSMGFVFQQPTMMKNLNILDNIILPALADNKNSREAIVEKGKLLMGRTGISGLENRYITEVSGGQLQRAGICRALINSPDIIFADEPTGSLNSKSTDEIMDLFLEINSGGRSILLVSHDAKISAYADRVLFMRDGKIIDELSTNKLINKGVDGKREEIKLKINKLGI